MKAITQQQLDRIVQAVTDHINGFSVRVGGIALPQDLLDRLARLGITQGNAPNIIFNSYIYGMFSAAFGEAADSMTVDEFVEHIKQVPFPLTALDRAALTQVRQSSYTHIKHMGDIINLQTKRIVQEANKQYVRRNAMHIKRQLEEGILKQKTIRQVANALKASTKVYAKNWALVAGTEINNAYASGRAQEIIKRNKGRDPRVYKKPRPDCCHHCARLYLEEDGTPKVFKMSELLANGTNVGRSKAEWKAVVESTHPSCYCKLYELPPGFGFDTEGRMVFQGVKKSSILADVIIRHRAA